MAETVLGLGLGTVAAVYLAATWLLFRGRAVPNVTVDEEARGDE